MKKISLNDTLLEPIEFTKDISKEKSVYDWLFRWREAVLSNGRGNFGDLIPSKKDFAKYLKVSTGTVQNAIRYLEDEGYFISKQCIGTMIKDAFKKDDELKMFSKKDKTLIEVKKYLILHKYDENEIIPSISELSSEIKTSTNTLRLALNELVQKKVLRKETHKKENVYIINSKIKLNEKEKSSIQEIKSKTLVKILKEKIKKYILENYKTGDKIPTNEELSKLFNVSIRTVNSSMKELNKDKFILSRRGSYGSIFLNTDIKEVKNEKSMFMSNPKSKREIKKSYKYKWENVLENITNYIIKNHEAGDKIPSMKEFASMLNVSVTTIKRAVKELSIAGSIYSQKGKYGGLFITEMPVKEDSYTWLAINPVYFEE